MLKKGLLFWGRFFVSLILVGIILYCVDINTILKCIHTANPIYVCLATIIAFISWGVVSYKWQILLRVLGISLRFKRLLALNFIAVFYSLFLPGQVSGDIVKGIKLNTEGIPLPPVITSIAADKLSSLFTLLVIGIFGIPFYTQDLRILCVFLGLLLIFFVFAFIILNKEALFLFEKHAKEIFISSKLILIRRYLGPLWNSFKTYRDYPFFIVYTLVLSFIFHLMVIGVTYLVSKGIGIDISFLEWMFIMAIVSVIQMLPISFAGIGVREGSYLFFLTHKSVINEQAVSLSLIVFGITLLMGITGGVLEMIGYE